MAGRISGITIEIDGNTTKLSTALQGVNKDIKNTQTALKDVNKLLKFDGGNVTLLKQKQEQLNTAIQKVKQRLEQEKQALKQLKQADQSPQVKAQMQALERQIEADEQELKKLQGEAKKFGSVTKQQFEAAKAKVKAFGEALKTIGQSMTNVGRKLTLGLTLPLVAFGKGAVSSFAEFDKTMTLTNATMGNTAEQAKLLDDAIKQAAANSTFGMTDAATAALNFARAGLTAEQAAATLAPAMNLAAGEGGNLDTVSAGLVGTINGFGDTFDNAGHYADVFAAACNNSALDVDSLSNSMGVAAPVFATAGRTVEDAAVALGVMANANIDADKAANALKTGIMRLAKPTKDMTEAMAKYGIETSEIWGEDGQMKSITEIQKNLHDSFAGLTEQEQLAAAAAIFGKNQGAAWLALINAAPEEVEALSESISNCDGVTQQMADTMMSGFGGSLEKLKSSIDVAKTSLGEALAPTISKVADKIQQLVDWFNSLDSSQQETIAKIGLVVAAIGPVLVIIGSVISAVGTIISACSGLGAAIGFLTGPFGWVALAIAAVITIGIELYRHWDQVKEMAGKLATWVVEKWNALKEGVKNAVNNMKQSVVDKWNAIKSAVQEFCNNIKSFVTEGWTAIKEKVSSVMDTIKTAVSDKWTAIKEKVSTTVDSIKESVSSKWDSIKSKLSTVYDSINTMTGGKLDTMKSKIQSAFDTAKNVVSTAVQALKNLMNFTWSLPHISLPHFSISGTFSLNPPSVPHISVAWYRKAYDNPIMFTQPTVLATANGYKGFGDGHGAEVVLGMDKLKELVGGTVVNNITVNPAPGMDERTLAAAVADAIQFRVDAEGAVWA